MSKNTDEDTGQAPRSQSPTPSGVSMKSDWSMLEPPKFSTELDPRQSRTQSPTPSGVSMKSDWSMLEPPKLSAESDPRPQEPRSQSPTPSGVSMKSDWSMLEPPKFSDESDQRPQEPKSQSPTPSGVSMKSDWSMLEPPKFSDESDQRLQSPMSSVVSMSSDWSMLEPPKFSGESSVFDPGQDKHRKESLDSSSVQSSKRFRSAATESDSDLGHQAPDQSLRIASTAIDNGYLKEVSDQNKAHLKKRVENIRECVLTPDTQTPHKSIYIDLYVTEGEGLTQEHEVLQIESGSTAEGTEETPINCNDIFKPIFGQEKHIRTVLTRGVACIGKTVLVQKFITDWAERKANQHIDLVFLLPFPLLNRMNDSMYSLRELLLVLHPELKNLKNDIFEQCQILFIFFALDESSLPLDFLKNQNVTDITEPFTVDALITSLIKGCLCSSSQIWITSRPVASNQIPLDYINKVTEVRGFTDQQKQEYFSKRIDDESQAKRVLSYIESSRSLHIMCRLPVFCWIAASVLPQMLKEGTNEKLPTTLTEMFMHFLLIQTTRGNQKYQGRNSQEIQNALESQKTVILKLSELAFKHLVMGNFLFSEKELKDYDLDITNALVHSGLCTDVFKGESVNLGKMYTFVHVTIQEFLAALYVFASYIDKNEETLTFLLKGKSKVLLKDMSLEELLKSAVNRALESKSGHLDLFVRFLHGMSLEDNQGLLKGLLTNTESNPESTKKAIQNLKGLNRPNISPDRWINLLHCLVELHDLSVQEEVNAYLKTGEGVYKKLKLAHCSALANILQLAKEPLDLLDLNEYKTSDEGRRRLVPAVRNCRKALLADCKLTEKCCEVVASAIESAHSQLTELDLSNNNLQKSEKKLFRALQNQHCKLESLSLAGCHLTAASCQALALALQAEHSHLKELDLSSNPVEDSGVEHLSAGLRVPHCSLQKLRLSGCSITSKSCGLLASVLEEKTCLTELLLRDNRLNVEDVKRLVKLKEDTKCALDTFEYS